jgi:hypothetical protein
MSRSHLAALGIALGTTLAVASLLMIGPAASAAQGSVPAEVTSYTTDPDGLVFQLNDLFGVGASGEGVDFDDTTTAGPLSRVFVWTDDFLAGKTTDQPVRRLNEWVTPISVRKSTIGFAVIAINDSTAKPELANFSTDSAVAAEFEVLPTDAYLVMDEPRAAWFSLLGKTLTPIDPGSTGLTGSTKLSEYQKVVIHTSPAGAKADTPDGGLIAGGVALVIILLAVVAVVVVPALLRRAKA